jgi:hypothetical protein
MGFEPRMKSVAPSGLCRQLRPSRFFAPRIVIFLSAARAVNVDDLTRRRISDGLLGARHSRCGEPNQMGTTRMQNNPKPPIQAIPLAANNGP